MGYQETNLIPAKSIGVLARSELNPALGGGRVEGQAVLPEGELQAHGRGWGGVEGGQGQGEFEDAVIGGLEGAGEFGCGTVEADDFGAIPGQVLSESFGA